MEALPNYGIENFHQAPFMEPLLGLQLALCFLAFRHEYIAGDSLLIIDLRLAKMAESPFTLTSRLGLGEGWGQSVTMYAQPHTCVEAA